MGAKWKTRSPAFSTRTHTKDLVRRWGHKTSQTKRKLFLLTKCEGRSHGRMGQMEGGKQTAKATKSENLNQC